MTSGPDYPRMLFHRGQPPVTVNSESEEKALGPEWSRTIPAGEPGESPPDEPGEEAPPQPVRSAAKRHR